MNKYYGNIGFVETVEDRPGVWVEHVLERSYYGDVNRFNLHNKSSDKVVSDLDVNHSISVVMDPYAYSNFKNIRYVEWMNNKWEVSGIEVQYPRLILTIGGEYVEQATGVTGRT